MIISNTGNSSINRVINTNYGRKNEKINVAIVDDNEKIISNICDKLSDDSEIEVVGKATNGEEAYDMIKKNNPDVVILDLIMPKTVSYTHLDVYKRQMLHRMTLMT